MKASVDQEVGKSFQQVKLAGERASGLTRQLLAFSRKQVLKRSAVDVGNTVKTMQKMLSRLVGETISFKILCATDVPCVLADESSIEQVLLNLSVNARDAMLDGGVLTITVEKKDLTPADVQQHEDARVGRHVVLTVQDTETGMNAETKRRLFEPFFTTKPVGKGTGVGLSTVYGIVKQHDGWIDIQSEVGVGTTFRIFLPSTEEKYESIETTILSKPETDRKECILVVEDEPHVRSYVCAALRAHGYQVLDADCGQKALEVWRNASGKIDLLLTDMVMPNGISGSNLAKMLREQKEDLKVIYMSGYSPDINANGDHFKESLNFLSKPFSPGKLLNIVDCAVNPVK